jgi:hypothetical protein
MPYTFVTPSVPEGPAGGHRLFDFYTLDRGVTVIKLNGKYQQVRYPDQGLLDAVDAYWLGGTTNVVSDEEAASLTAAGYGNYLTEIV